MVPETRRAHAAFDLHDAAGAAPLTGEGTLQLNDDALDIGIVHVSYLDVDALRAADYRIELDVWPHRRLTLTQLGRRFDTILEELRRVRNQSRVAGLLAHGITTPLVFNGAFRSADDARFDVSHSQLQHAEFQVYDTHVTIVPVDGNPWQLPYGAITGLREVEDPPAIVAECREGATLLGQLGRQRDALFDAVAEHRNKQDTFLLALTGVRGFADGWGLTRDEVSGFEALIQRFTARNRVDCSRRLLELADGQVRFGFVQLLDPDGDHATSDELPEPWASFLLVSIRDLTVLEVLAGAAAATYVFRGSIESVNRDLQLLHFRRAPLALTAEQAVITAANPFRLALRQLEPLGRLRRATVARIIHTDGWEQAIRSSCAS